MADSADRTDTDAARRHGRDKSGKYRELYVFLERRYADLVVLSFAQIESLIGFALPDRARTDSGWWTAADATSAEGVYANAWALAGRTAKPNLLARNVAFERGSR